MKLLTIFTPTYNRGDYLGILYNTIKQSLNKNKITWLIVDDGSTDNTKEVVSSFVEEGAIDIKYYFTNNGGKYKAYNKAIDLVSTPYFVCIDSDDKLSNVKSVDIMIKNMELLHEKDIGCIYPFLNSKTESMVFDKMKGIKINVSDVKLKYGLSIETTIVFKTSVLKKYKFIENDEKFQSEEIFYNYFIHDGKFVFLEDFLVTGEYLETGLTRNIYKLWFNNYKNSLLLFSSRYQFIKATMKCGLAKTIEISKCVINKNAICMAKKLSIIRNSDSPILSVLLYFPSVAYKYLKYDRGGLKE